MFLSIFYPHMIVNHNANLNINVSALLNPELESLKDRNTCLTLC